LGAKKGGEIEMNESGIRREKLVYRAPHSLRSEQKEVIDISVRNFLDVAHWATNRQIQIGIRGYAEKRYSTLERYLKRKCRKGELRWANYNHKTKVYAKKMKTKNFDPEDTLRLYHGVATTECFIRFMIAKEGEALPERMFRSYGRVPEFAMRYENGSLLLCEFSTKHDVTRTGKIRGKLDGYDDCLPDIEREFSARPVVVFVLDVPRERVRQVVTGYQPSAPFWFTDYQTFCEVPLGQSLTAPIYIWRDGKEYPLTK
jgi:hypothetical protein